MKEEKQGSLITFSLKMIWRRWWKNTAYAILRPVSVFVRETYMVLALMLIMSRVETIKGWNFYEMILCQSFISMTYGILLIFFTGFRSFRIQDKRFRVFLLRPKGILQQIMLDEEDWFAVPAHLALGILLFVVSMLHLPVQMTVAKAVALVLNLAGGVLIQAAAWVFLASLQCFFGGRIRINSIFWSARSFLRLPLCIYPAVFGKLLVYVIPFGFVSYFPVLQLLGRTDADYPAWFGYLALPVGVVLYGAAYLLWRWGVQVYRRRG